MPKPYYKLPDPVKKPIAFIAAWTITAAAVIFRIMKKG